MLFVCHPKILHRHCFQILLGHFNSQEKKTEDNAYAKFWGDKQRALGYVMVFSVVVNRIAHTSEKSLGMKIYLRYVSLFVETAQKDVSGKNSVGGGVGGWLRVALHCLNTWNRVLICPTRCIFDGLDHVHRDFSRIATNPEKFWY